MAIHKPWDRTFYALSGSTMKTGFSLNLKEGQFGIFNVSKQTPKGAVAVESFEDYEKDTTFELRLGNRQMLSRSTSNKMYSSFPFHIKDVVELRVSAPKSTEMKVDEVVIGYDGTNPDTSLKMFKGEYKEISLELTSKAFEYLGIEDGIANIIVPLMPEAAPGVCDPKMNICDPAEMKPIVENAVDFLKNYEFRGGAKLTDYVEVSLVDGNDGKYGIRIKGKTFKISTGEALRDQLGYIEDSTQIRAGGGYITDFNWATTGGKIEDRPFSVTYVSRYEPRTHVAGNMLDEEQRNKTFFTGRLFNHDYMGRLLTGNESNIINLDAQLVDYAVTIRRNIYSQGLSQRLEETITYHIMTELGKHNDVEDVLNSLATAAGIEGVKASPETDTEEEEGEG